MAEDEGNRQDHGEEGGSGSDSAGEGVSYISLEQARALCIRTANVTPGAYGRRFGRVPMVFEVAFEEETDDHYVITLSFRPQGQFFGTWDWRSLLSGKKGLSMPGGCSIYPDERARAKSRSFQYSSAWWPLESWLS